MSIPDNLTKCVCFLCTRDRNGNYIPRGTAFFIAVRMGDAATYTYLVTAKHSIEMAKPHGSLYARLNVEPSSTVLVELASDWVYNNANPGSDVAVLPFEVPDRADVVAVPTEMFATDEIIAEKQIGLGDDLVVTGLFTKLAGKAKNIPVIRKGNIAAMPDEIIVGHYAEEYRAYLIELKSTSGLSGSPVFVTKTWLDPKNKTPNLGLQRSTPVFLLLAIIRGHWDQKITAANMAGDWEAEPFNTGIATATPIQECIQILNCEALSRHRGFSTKV